MWGQLFSSFSWVKLGNAMGQWSQGHQQNDICTSKAEKKTSTLLRCFLKRAVYNPGTSNVSELKQVVRKSGPTFLHNNVRDSYRKSLLCNKFLLLKWFCILVNYRMYVFFPPAFWRLIYFLVKEKWLHYWNLFLLVMSSEVTEVSEDHKCFPITVYTVH